MIADSFAAAPTTAPYAGLLMAVFVLLAVLSSYLGIYVVNRMHGHTSARRLWLAAGAAAVATGLWTMSFTGLMAVRSTSGGYRLIPALESWMVILAAVFVGLCVCSARRLVWWSWLSGAAVLVLGAAAMAERGAAALQIESLPVYSSYRLVLAGILAALTALVGLPLAYYLRDKHGARTRAVAAAGALLLGAGMSAMPYAALGGMSLNPPSMTGAGGLSLALSVGCGVCLLLLVMLLVSALDRRMDRHTAELVDSLAQAKHQLAHSSHHDVLTGLPNRLVIEKRIDSAMARSRRDGTRFALLYIDLDGFKLINDSLGHAVGDILLLRTVGLLRQQGGAINTIARMGGDEFLLLRECIGSDADIEALGRRLVHSIADIHERGAHLSASIGAVIFPEASTADAAALISAADVAMFAAKRAGKNRFEWHVPAMSKQAADTFVLREELRRGIARGEMVVYYQPKYRSRDQKLVGAEALVRWQHPERGLLGPGDFIAMAEQGGLIGDLEIAVLDRVCEQTRQWLDNGLDVPPISVNLSAARVLDTALAQKVMATLDRYRLQPWRLVFEITETMAMQNIARAISALVQLRTIGVRISLDDFGTGYSSLSYLRQLPIQQLKIDRSFISNLDSHDSAHKEIVRAIIGLAHALKLDVVAEGVEHWHQFNSLKEMDCEEIQGFLLNKPLPAEIFAGELPAATSGHIGRTSALTGIR